LGNSTDCYIKTQLFVRYQFFGLRNFRHLRFWRIGRTRSRTDRDERRSFRQSSSPKKQIIIPCSLIPSPLLPTHFCKLQYLASMIKSDRRIGRFIYSPQASGNAKARHTTDPAANAARPKSMTTRSKSPCPGFCELSVAQPKRNETA